MAAPEVGLTAEKATRVGRRLRALEELAPSIANLWLFHFASGNLGAAEETSSDLFRIARELDSPGVLLQAHHAAWPVDWVRGSLASAAAHIDKGLAIYDEERHAHHRYTYLGHDPAVCGLGIGSQLYWAIGQPTRAIEARSRALTLARRLKHEPTLVHALWFVTEGQIDSRDVGEVLENTSEILKLSRDLPQQRATGLVFRGWALAASGNIAEGLALADEGIEWLERSANKAFLARLYLPAAEAYFLAGRHAEGLRIAERGLQILSEMGNVFCRPRMLQIHAKLLQAIGRDGDAEASLAQSLELARAQGAKLFELRAATEIARLWRAQGRHDEMRGLIKPICDSFIDGSDTPDFRAAKELLETH
jgi:predicted ATPase